MSRSRTSHTVEDQLSGIVVDIINNAREQAKTTSLHNTDKAFSSAMEEMQKIRNFIGSPENILGNPATKHGEIAEQLEVGIRNARSALKGETLTASIDNIGRTDSVDYIINGDAVQSKFYNGANNTLKGVLEHMNKYSNFGRDGSSYYHIPKDQYEDILRLRNDPHAKTAILEKIAEIERLTGKPFDEVVRPGISTYAEPQQGAVHRTIDRHEQDIKRESDLKKEQIQADHQPSLAGAAQASAIAGGLAAGIGLSVSLYRKYKGGKNIFKGELTAEDWKEVGIDASKSGVGGAIAGGSIYILTNYADLSAPFAGAIVSATKGVASLSADLASGKINTEEFLELGLAICSESAIVGLATVAGQTLIPIPVLGAVIGSISGKMLTQFAVGLTKADGARVRAEMQAFLDRLDEASKRVIAEIDAKFDKLGDLTKAAFDFELNRRLILCRSAELATAYQVKESEILRTVADVDAFMMS